MDVLLDGQFLKAGDYLQFNDNIFYAIPKEIRAGRNSSRCLKVEIEHPISYQKAQLLYQLNIYLFRYASLF